MALQHLQRRLARALMFGQLSTGKQGHHRLAQFVGVTTVEGVRGPPVVCLPRLGQLFGRPGWSARSIPSMGPLASGSTVSAGQLDSRRVPAPTNAIALITSSPT